MYDPNSPNEQPVPLPSAPLKVLAKNVVLQPPLTRRGTGPGLIVFLPADDVLSKRSQNERKPLDPEPVQKWAEEGFAVVGIQSGSGPVNQTFALGLDALAALESCDTKDKIAVIVYDEDVIPTLIPTLSAALTHSKPVDVYMVAYCSPQTVPDVPTSPHSKFTFPTLLHVPTTEFKPLSDAHMDLDLTQFAIHTYSIQVQSEAEIPSPFFVLPQTSTYAPGHASVAHTRTLVFLRKHLGGPVFDLEKIWDEHTKYEFDERSVAKTMGTMVQEPYVNHVPTMTGGIGREALTAFYRDHFIFSNPPDAKLDTISRTVGPDRVVGKYSPPQHEFIYSFTHTQTVDWLLPGVPPSGKKVRVPMMAVVNIRGDRLYNEHIWWDQGTVLRQVGVLPTHLPFGPESGSGQDGSKRLRLPVAGAETADMLLDEVNGKSNIMFGEGWGIA